MSKQFQGIKGNAGSSGAYTRAQLRVKRRREPGCTWGPGMQPQSKPLEENILMFMEAGRVGHFIKEPGTAKPAAGNCLHPGRGCKQHRAEAPPSVACPTHPLGECGEGPLPCPWSLASVRARRQQWAATPVTLQFTDRSHGFRCVQFYRRSPQRSLSPPRSQGQ